MTIDNTEHRLDGYDSGSIKATQISEMLFMNSTQALAFFDRNLQLTQLNKTFSNLFGHSSVKMEAMNISYLAVSQHSDFEALMEELIKGRLNKFTIEVTCPNLDLKKNIMQVSFSRNKHKNEFSGGLISVVDVTQHRMAQRLLEQKNKELEEKNKELAHLSSLSDQLQSFAYVASHDLKEPLRTIGNFSQLLERQANGYIDDTGKEYLAYIRDGVKSMNALIDDLLQYSTLDTRSHIKQSIHVPTIMFILTKMNEQQLIKANAVVELGEMPENIIGDKTKFRLLWECLFSNAFKYRKKGKPLIIKISGRNIKNGWEYSISDNGIGIKEEYFTKIFEMFKKLHGKKDYEGTGIGLALCKKIVEQHNGQISVKSEENVGSTFTFTLMKS